MRSQYSVSYEQFAFYFTLKGHNVDFETTFILLELSKGHHLQF